MRSAARVNMVYIVANNGVYGLTKGQFSATADKGAKLKKGTVNTDDPIDLVMMALHLGATFVARSFSGDKGQLVPLIKAAIEHKGPAFIDCISPCVAFNNHEGSTKSFDYVRAHNEAVNALDFISERAPITADYAPGEAQIVKLHDGSTIRLRKIGAGYDVHNRVAAINYLLERENAGEIVTGPRLPRGRARRHARPPANGRQAAEPARRRGADSGFRGAGQDQRGIAVSKTTSGNAGLRPAADQMSAVPGRRHQLS